MRLSNFKNIQGNKASIFITPTLYDRRALDCTVDKPLVNSLNNLTFLASSSSKVRDTLMADGGIQRLVEILQECHLSTQHENEDVEIIHAREITLVYQNFVKTFGGFLHRVLIEKSSILDDNISSEIKENFDMFSKYLSTYAMKKSLATEKAINEHKMLVSWKWTLALQVIVICGTRGDESMRRKIVDSGIIPLTCTVLDNYLLIKNGSIDVDHEDVAKQFNNTSYDLKTSAEEVLQSIHSILSTFTDNNRERATQVTFETVQEQIQSFVSAGTASNALPQSSIQLLSRLLVQTLHLLSRAMDTPLENTDMNLSILYSVKSNINQIRQILKGFQGDVEFSMEVYPEAATLFKTYYPFNSFDTSDVGDFSSQLQLFATSLADGLSDKSLVKPGPAKVIKDGKFAFWPCQTLNKEVTMYIDDAGCLVIDCIDKDLAKDFEVVARLVSQTWRHGFDPLGEIGMDRFSGCFKIFITGSSEESDNTTSSSSIGSSSSASENFRNTQEYPTACADLFHSVFFRNEKNEYIKNRPLQPLQPAESEQDSVMENSVDNIQVTNSDLAASTEMLADTAIASNTTTMRANNTTASITDTASNDDNPAAGAGAGAPNITEIGDINNNRLTRAFTGTETATPTPTTTNNPPNQHTNADVWFTPPRKFYRGKIVPTDDDVIWVLQFLAFVSKYPYIKSVLEFAYILPKISIRVYPNDPVGMEYCYNECRKGFASNTKKKIFERLSRKIIEDHFNKGWDKLENECLLLEEKFSSAIGALPFFLGNESSISGYDLRFSPESFVNTLETSPCVEEHRISNSDDKDDSDEDMESSEMIEHKLFKLKLNVELEKLDENIKLIERTNREDLAELYYLIAKLKDHESFSDVQLKGKLSIPTLANYETSDDSSGDDELIEQPSLCLHGLTRSEIEKFDVKYLDSSFDQSGILNGSFELNNSDNLNDILMKGSNDVDNTFVSTDQVSTQSEASMSKAKEISKNIDKAILLYEINKKFEKISRINSKITMKLRKIKHYESEKRLVTKKWDYDQYNFDDCDYSSIISPADDSYENHTYFQKLKDNFIHLPMNFYKHPIIISMIDNYSKGLPRISHTNFSPLSESEEEIYKKNRSTLISKHDLDYSMLPLDYLNIFGLVEKFSTSDCSHEIKHWAGFIMRNLCRKDSDRGGVRQCANTLCGRWESRVRRFSKCRRCKRAKYCSRECQQVAWKYHRYWCKPSSESSTGSQRNAEI